MSLLKRDIATVVSYKAFLLEKNNEKTTALIRGGFTWAGLLFSMSDVAQINWSNFLNIPDGLFPYPVTSKDDGDIVNIELADRENFYFTVLGFKSGILQVGSTTREAIKASTTIEQLQAIEDTL